MNAKKLLAISTAIFISFGLFSCGGGGGGGIGNPVSFNNNGAGIISLSISPSNPTMLAGATLPLTAMAKYSDNTYTDVSIYTDLSWSSSNTSIVSISGRKINAISPGTATVSASMGGATAAVTVTVKAVTNKVILYVATSSDTSEYFSGYNITVDSNAQTIIRVIPEENLADVVDTNTSYSFADSTIYPYTVDNRLFIRTDVRPYEYSGHHGYVENDPKSNMKILSFGVSAPNSAGGGRSAILGTSYYYRENRTYDFLYGDRGGDFKKLTISDGVSGKGSVLLNYSDTENFSGGSLQASNGNLYDARYYVNAAYTTCLDFYKRDLTTGKIVLTRSLSIRDPSQYGTPKMTFDGSTGYMAIRNNNLGEIEIWKNDLSGASTSITKIFNSSSTGITNIHYFDASNGYLAIGDQTSKKILLYDASTGTSSTIDMGFSFYAVEVLYLK